MSFFCLDLFRVERGERGERTETKKPDLEENRKQKTHFLLSSFFFLLSSPSLSFRFLCNLRFRYSFEYPSSWKTETIGKQQKGMVGIDSKVTNPRAKRE